MGLPSPAPADKFPFGEIEPPWWDDAPTLLVGGGPSLYGFDFQRLKGIGHVVGVNRSMFDAPVECGVSVDHTFVARYIDQLRTFAKQRPLYLVLGNEWWTDTTLSYIEGATYLRSRAAGQISQDPKSVLRGSTSGFAALNIGVIKRSKSIYLLGYDYSAFGGRHHYHDDYPWYRAAYDQSWGVWSRYYNEAATICQSIGVTIQNASERSHLSVFPKLPLELIPGLRPR